MRWKTISSKYLVQDKWLTLRVDDCRTPAGVGVTPYYVFEYPDWVNLIPITRDKMVVMVRQYRHGLGRTLLELVGGGVDPGDDNPEAAARRELLEETGFAGGEYIKTGVLSPNPANHNNLCHCFLALGVEPRSVPSPDETEDLRVELRPLEDIVAMARKGGLMQALHVASVFMALDHLK